MKHVIIAGCTRSGKTKLSLFLHKKGYVHYKLDTIKRAMCSCIPIKINKWDDYSPIMSSMINTIISENGTDSVINKEFYCLETCHVYPNDIYNQKIDNTLIVFLGYPNINKKEKIKNVRKYDKKNMWTTNMSDIELDKLIDICIQYSKEIERQCLLLGIPFFDTSYDYNKAVKDALTYIENNT